MRVLQANKKYFVTYFLSTIKQNVIKIVLIVNISEKTISTKPYSPLG